jgi:mRNA-degrading endonuclease toxin of MazEF toxin-antitoxin module
MIRRADVVTVADRSGDATGKPSPAVIVGNDLLVGLNWVLVCPITSMRPSEPRMFVRELARGAHLPLQVPSWAEPHKLTAIRRSRVGTLIGKIADVDLAWLNRILPFVLGIS